MLLAGLTGFLNSDAENMKAEVAAKRKAEADRLAGITGWRKKVAENAMKNSSEQESTLLKAKLEGKVSFTDQFATASAENKEYINGWNPSMGAFDVPNKDLSKFAKIISDTDKYKTFIRNAAGKPVFKSKADTSKANSLNLGAFLIDAKSNLSNPNFLKDLADKNVFDDKSFLEFAATYDASVFTVQNDAKKDNPDYVVPDLEKLYSFRTFRDIAKNRNVKLKSLTDLTESTSATIDNNNNMIVYNIDGTSEKDQSASGLFLNAIKATEDDVADVWSGYTLASQTSVQKNNSLIMAKELYKNPNEVKIEALDPDRGIDYTSIFANQESTVRFHSYLMKAAKNANIANDDHVGKIVALSSAMTTEKGSPPKKQGDMNYYMNQIPKIENMKVYAVSSVFNLDKPENGIKKFEEIKTEKEFANNVYTQLNMYRDARKGVGKGVAAVESIMTKLGIIVDTDTGVIGTIINRFNSGESGIAGEGKVISVNGVTQSAEGVDDSANNKKELTSGYLKTLETNTVGKAGKNTELAKLEALRISLAFMLARLADPSGRLSNQDIDQQLRRLGGVGLNDGEMDDAKISLLIDETLRKRDKYSTIISIADSGAIADDRAKRLIDAAISYDKLKDSYGLYNAQGKIDGSQGSGNTGTSVDLKEMYKDKPRYRPILPNSETYKNNPSLSKRFPNGYHLDSKDFNKIAITPKTGA